MLAVPTLQTPTPAVPATSAASVVILHTIDLPADACEIMRSFGKLVQYDPLVEGSLPVATLKFDYLALDMRRKADRIYYDQNDMMAYPVIAFISTIEQFDSLVDSLGASNVITEFPPKTHFREDWDKLLRGSPTPSPSRILSCMTFFSNWFDSLKKKPKP